MTDSVLPQRWGWDRPVPAPRGPAGWASGPRRVLGRGRGLGASELCPSRLWELACDHAAPRACVCGLHGLNLTPFPPVSSAKA